jgi:hypothetical protein
MKVWVLPKASEKDVFVKEAKSEEIFVYFMNKSFFLRAWARLEGCSSKAGVYYSLVRVHCSGSLGLRIRV